MNRHKKIKSHIQEFLKAKRLGSVDGMCIALEGISKLVTKNHTRPAFNTDFLKIPYLYFGEIATIIADLRSVAYVHTFRHNLSFSFWKELELRYDIRNVIVGNVSYRVVYKIGSDRGRGEMLVRYLGLPKEIRQVRSGYKIMGFLLGYPWEDIDAFVDWDFRKVWKEKKENGLVEIV